MRSGPWHIYYITCNNCDAKTDISESDYEYYTRDFLKHLFEQENMGWVWLGPDTQYCPGCAPKPPSKVEDVVWRPDEDEETLAALNQVLEDDAIWGKEQT